MLEVLVFSIFSISPTCCFFPFPFLLTMLPAIKGTKERHSKLERHALRREEGGKVMKRHVGRRCDCPKRIQQPLSLSF